MKRKKKFLLLLAIETLVLVPLYFVLSEWWFPYIQYAYLAMGAGAGFWYVIYNKGFAYRGLAPDELSNDLKPEERRAFAKKMEERYEKSKWILTFLLPIIFAIVLDCIYLFCMPALEDFFS